MYRLFFTGDIVLSNYNENSNFLSEGLQNIIRQCDIVCCNYEAPTGTSLFPKKKIGPNNKNAIGTATMLKDAGFNLAALSNNHIFDFGIEGIESTLTILHNAGIDTVGAGLNSEEIVRPYIFEGVDCKIGVINLCENGFGCCVDKDDTYGYAYIYEENVKKRLIELKKRCDIVFVVCHAGAEMWSLPLPEWRTTYKKLIDWGADAIIAHHPHVPQGYEEYKGKVIFYSLGNFAFDKGSGVIQPSSICVLFTIDNLNISYEVIPTVFENGVVNICHNYEFSKYLSDCCNILKDNDRYMREVNKKCIETYKSYREAYRKVVVQYRGGLKEWVKGIVKKYLMRINFQDIWLYHNLNIETHLYICKRATRLLLKEKNIL